MNYITENKLPDLLIKSISDVSSPVVPVTALLYSEYYYFVLLFRASLIASRFFVVAFTGKI
jgi:hypothetical protein